MPKLMTAEDEARINARAEASRLRFEELVRKAQAEGRELIPQLAHFPERYVRR